MDSLSIAYTSLSTLVFVAVVIGVSVLSRGSSKDAATRRALRTNKQISVDKIKDGATVKVSGRMAFAQVPLVAPLSGRRCAAWEVIVERRMRRGMGTRWEEIINEQRAQDFYLDDGTGRALVKARSPMMALYRDACFYSDPRHGATPRLEAYLESHGCSSLNALGESYEIVYHEGVLEEGEQVAVLGTARLEADPDAEAEVIGYRDPATRVVVDEPDEDPLMLSDTRAAAG